MIETICRCSLAGLLCAGTILSATPASGQYVLLTPTVLDVARPPADAPAVAQPPPAVPRLRPSLLAPFVGALGDLRRVPASSNLAWLVVGMAGAATAHTGDAHITEHFANTRTPSFRPGSVIGGTPFELGSAFAAYAIGRSTGSPRVMQLGSDLIRAQVVAELLTTGIKQTARRARPDGSGFSFPSGHTTVTFASATVLQQHFGWKVGVPAYAVASYVAASRVEMKRHYLSDVAFGAALGIVAGRTVTIGRKQKFTLAPIVAPLGDGAGAGLTWVPPLRGLRPRLTDR
jgi:membrane-associated phospholipid phosphatase